jgi:hypothetical protein
VYFYFNQMQLELLAANVPGLRFQECSVPGTHERTERSLLAVCNPKPTKKAEYRKFVMPFFFGFPSMCVDDCA